MNESKIIQKAQKGNRDAFSVLFEKYKDYVWNVVYRMTYNFDESEDIAQDVFITAWNKLSTFRTDSAFSTWLYRITVNKTLNRIRSRHNNQSLSDETLAAQVDTQVYMRQNPETAVDELETEQILANLLNRMDPDRRLVVILRELEGLTYEEIAEITGTPVGTVRSRISRGRKELSEMASQHGKLP